MAHSSQTFTINDATNRSVNMQSIMEPTATTSTSSEATSLTTTSSGLTNEINDDNSSSFMCQVCGKMLLSLQKLQLHLGKTHCEKRKYMCPHCHKLFNERGNRHRHIRVVHYKERNYLCDLCGQSFGQVNTLHQHRNSCQTGRRSLAKCHFCKFKVNNSLKSNRMMVDHYKEVHGIELLHCSNCPDIYYSLESYNKHLKDFLYEASECKLCDIQFTNQCSMRAHSCELTDAVTKHVCGVCCKSFLTSTSFKYHQRTHDGQKPHACKICDSRFRQAAHLKIHQLKHSNERSQKCLLCKKTYKARNDLKLHYRNVHKIILPKYIVGDITVDDLSKGEPVDDDNDDGGGFVNVGGGHDDVDTVLAYMTCDNDDDDGADKNEEPENENSCNAGNEDEDDDDNDSYGGYDLDGDDYDVNEEEEDVDND
ncbi:hypothetical protein HELRODRAFT_107257 [Helobdella robusta]|uniref:C2H2-type domain-containing protein n=1 Tax=Helobdella robusta TaxID=6412 RepID=T1EE91_HELRO|nr:hypothetical protein HELRODRAFT_107257 [Helobdella robusta]ESN96007.1 hypothetical protein HELRODRAFT_107257 [Helobdella robusta]